ncbi:MAG: extracellular solute-binding protein, partial [Bacillota bacterium]|nr:extracellular solute-binding protein [Bacillota bacterium]
SAEDKDKILKNVVSSEVNVKDVLGKVLLGEADCGVVYNTDLSAAMSDKAEAVRLKELDSVTAEYPAAVIKSTRNKTEAELFIKFITTGKGRDILIKYGFDAG